MIDTGSLHTLLRLAVYSLLVHAQACTEEELRGEFRGKHNSGFEYNVFFPCGSSERWEAVGAPLWDAEYAFRQGVDAGVVDNISVYLRVRGVRSATLEDDGVDYETYDRQLVVEEVLEIVRVDDRPEFCEEPPN